MTNSDFLARNILICILQRKQKSHRINDAVDTRVVDVFMCVSGSRWTQSLLFNFTNHYNFIHEILFNSFGNFRHSNCSTADNNYRQADYFCLLFRLLTHFTVPIFNAAENCVVYFTTMFHYIGHVNVIIANDIQILDVKL